MADQPGADRLPRELSAGTKVEVRNRFDGTWAGGFVVDGTDDEGRYRVVRRSDGAALPSPFDRDDLRRERTRQTWWV